jgi:hypothetical protein
MSKKILSVLLACAMVASTVLFGTTSKADTLTQNQWNSARYGEKIDIGSKLRAQENDPELRAKMDNELIEASKGIDFDADTTVNATASDSSFTYDGGSKWFIGYDNVYGNYLKKYTLRSIGDKVEVWVANDLGYYSIDPETGDEIPDPSRPADVVTQEQVDQLRDEFDNNIFQKDTEFFGAPASRDGDEATLPAKVGLPSNYYTPSDGKERVIMLVDNVRDELFYDPTYPFYIAGFFTSTFSRYFDRNVITIDSYKWDKKLSNNDIYGTIAHEFQHLIHRDNDMYEESWINEGMADFAQYLCGYGHDWGHVNYFLDHPENSLVSWDEYYDAETGPETLADYGQAYLLQLYINDHFGKDFVKALAKDTDQGIVSVNKILKQFNTGIDFTELFRRFSAALAVDSRNPGNGIYNFDSIDVKVNYTKAQTYQKDGVPAWGVDYIKLDNIKNIKDIVFNGISFVPNIYPWTVVNNPIDETNKVIWGNKTDDHTNNLVFEADLSNIQSATLKFDSLYNIEESWDYGFVQVSVDNGKTWTSLSNANTRNDLDVGGRESIRQYLPGFTGTNGAWGKEEFDLSAYVGKKILVNFRYMTDDATTEAGWFIDNIEIPEISYKNDCSDISKFLNLEKILGNYINYSVTFVNEKYTNKGTDPQHYQVKTINLFNMNDEDSKLIQKYLSSGNNYMLIWYAAPVGTKGVADYSYEIIQKNKYSK